MPEAHTQSLRGLFDASCYKINNTGATNHLHELKRPRSESETHLTSKQRNYERRRKRLSHYHKEDSKGRHWGTVPEPFLSPLHGINLLMEEFDRPPVSMEEAEEEVSQMVQQHASYSQPSQRSREQATHRRRTARDGLHTSVLSGPQGSLTQQTPQALEVDVQDALIIEALKGLCERRGLRVRRSTYSEMKKSRGRVCFSDIQPHRRVVVVADRREPIIALIFGVPHCESSTAAADPDMIGGPIQTTRIAKEKPRHVEWVQIFGIASMPGPWRRLVRTFLPCFFHKECVIAYVEEDDVDGDSKDNDATDAATVCGLKRRAERGVTGEDNYGSVDCKWPHVDNERLSSTSSVDSDSPMQENDEAMYNKIVPRRYGKAPLFSEKDRIENDPFLQIPRVEVRGGATFRRRSWMQRLLHSCRSGRSITAATMYNVA